MLLMLIMRLYLILTLYPYTTLFRSEHRGIAVDQRQRAVPGRLQHPHRVAVCEQRAADDRDVLGGERVAVGAGLLDRAQVDHEDRKSTRLNSSHTVISYAVFCLKKKT